VRLRPGTLLSAITVATERALSSGALQPLHSTLETVEDGGIAFVVRRGASLARKPQEQIDREAAQSVDPFLPYEPNLFVAHLSQTHAALLNKFPVLDHHLLIVTRAFEHQETLLNERDFDALGICLNEFQGLGFYNGGREAGASQDHKHLQVVSLPVALRGNDVPIEPLLRRVANTKGIGTVPGLPFRHAYARLASNTWSQPQRAGRLLAEVYRQLLAATDIEGRIIAGEPRQSQPYNLLVARKWMLLIPRSRERYASISVNALGFAGSLFVKSDAEFETVQRRGPLGVLTEVAVTR